MVPTIHQPWLEFIKDCFLLKVFGDFETEEQNA